MKVSRFCFVVYLQLLFLFVDLFINSFGELFRTADVVLLLLYITFAQLYNAAASPALHFPSAGLLGIIQNSRCLHYLCNYSGIFGVLQHIHFSSWPSVTLNKKVQDDNNYLNNLLSVVCGASCMDHVIEMGCSTEICLERSISSSLCFSENRSRFILLFLQKDCSTVRRPKILQGLPVAARRIFKDSLTF